MVLKRKYKENQVFKNRSTEHGSAMMIIFVLIALFAALSYAFSDGTRSGSQQISKEKAKLAASEILDYASKIKRAVQQLQINGCTIAELSFDNAVVSGYSNTNAPSDNSCHLFNSNGGGMIWRTSPQQVDNNRNYFYDGNNSLNGLTTNGQILIQLAEIPNVICEQINNQLTQNTSFTATTYSSTKFQGTLSGTGNINCTPQCEQSFCLASTGWTEGGSNLGASNIFIQVLATE